MKIVKAYTNNTLELWPPGHQEPIVLPEEFLIQVNTDTNMVMFDRYEFQIERKDYSVIN